MFHPDVGQGLKVNQITNFGGYKFCWNSFLFGRDIWIPIAFNLSLIECCIELLSLFFNYWYINQTTGILLVEQYPNNWSKDESRHLINSNFKDTWFIMIERISKCTHEAALGKSPDHKNPYEENTHMYDSKWLLVHNQKQQFKFVGRMLTGGNVHFDTTV